MNKRQRKKNLYKILHLINSLKILDIDIDNGTLLNSIVENSPESETKLYQVLRTLNINSKWFFDSDESYTDYLIEERHQIPDYEISAIVIKLMIEMIKVKPNMGMSVTNNNKFKIS